MSIATITNTNNENINTNIPNISEEITTSGYLYNEEELDSSETLEAVESMITSHIEENSSPKMNRAQRRAIFKRMGKKGRREQIGIISETAKKLNYIELIQRLREMNKKNKEVNNDEN